MVLRLQVLSDLHLEHWRRLPQIPVVARNIALLGDIGYPRSQIYQDFIAQCSERYQRVFLIAGNHEYDHARIQDVDRFIGAFAREFPNVHYLQRTSVFVDRYKIIGTTLWTNDYFPGTLVKTDSREISRLHNQNLAFLERELRSGALTIVLTHHAPLYTREIAGPFWEHPRARAFFNRLDHLFTPPLVAWGFGHTHYNSRVNYKTIDGTLIRLMTNQMGYNQKQNARFENDYAVDFK